MQALVSRLSSRRRRRLISFGDAKRKEGDFKAARAAYRRVIEAGGDVSASWLARLAQVDASLGDWSSAIANYSAALSLDASQGRWHFALGRAYQHQGDERRATHAFSAAIEQAPDRIDWQLAAADAYFGLHLWPEAIHAYLSADRLGELDSAALERLGQAQRRQKDWAAAVETLERARSLGSDSATLHYRLGASHQKLRDWVAARTELQRAVELAPANARWWIRLAEVNEEIGDWNRAAEAYQTAIDHHGNEPTWHHRLGRAYERAGDLRRAAHAYEAAVLRDGQVAKWHAALGSVYTKMGDWEYAIRSYEAAIELDDGKPKWHQRLGLAHQRRRDWPAAAAAYRRAVELEPDNRTWRDRLVAAEDRIAPYGPPAHKKPRFLDGILAFLKSEVAQRDVHAVGVGSGYVPGSESDPLIRFLLDLDLPARERCKAMLIEAQPDRVESLHELFRGHSSVTIQPYAVGGTGSALTLYQITDEARAELLAAGSTNDGRRYTSADRDLVIRRFVERLGFSEQEAEEKVEPFEAETRLLTDLLEEQRYPSHFDLLQIDIQGLDGQVIHSIDMQRFRPRIISYEIAHLPDDERARLRQHLRDHGYECRRVSNLDEVAVQVQALEG